MFKNLKLYFIYRKTIKSNLAQLKEKFINSKEKTYIIKDIKIDWLCRLYTVLNFIPQSKENVNKYGYYYIDNEVKKFIQEIGKELNEMGLFELYGLGKADQIKPDKVLIIVDFKPFHTEKKVRSILISTLLVLLAGILGYIIFFKL